MNWNIFGFGLFVGSILQAAQLSCSGAWHSDAQIQLPDAEATVEHYADGRLRRSVLAPKDSAGLATLNRIIRSKNGKWRSSIATHAPVAVIRGNRLKVTFHKGAIVANYMNESGQSRQIECAMSDEEFTQVCKAVEEILDEKSQPKKEPEKVEPQKDRHK